MSRALIQAAAPLSPERQALADAIAEATPRRAALDKARAAAEAARGAVTLALAAGPAAEREAEAVKAHLIENPHADRAKLRAARQAVVDAADDLAIAREIATRADAAETEAERHARYGDEAVERAASDILVTAYGAAIEAAETAARHAARLGFVAIAIARNADHWSGDRNTKMIRAQVLNPHLAFGSDGGAAADARAAAEAPWRAALAALQSDPSAPLPAL